MSTDPILSAEEITRITGRTSPAAQVKALHEMGYWLARLTPAGVSLPRVHYEAVCAGAVKQTPAAGPVPFVMQPNPTVVKRQAQA